MFFINNILKKITMKISQRAAFSTVIHETQSTSIQRLKVIYP